MFFSDHRFQQITDHGAFLFPELKISQSQTYHRITGPGMYAPMHETGANGKPGCFLCQRFNARHGSDIMGQRFRHAPEYQAYAHSRAKEHGKPGHRTVFRLIVIISQPHLTEPAESYYQQKQDKKEHHAQIKPGKIPF